jgi:glutathione S-transferase
MKMGRTGFPDKDMNEALDRLKRAVERVGDWLAQSRGPWLTGKELTIADIAIMPIIVRMADINLKYIWDKLPVIEKWYSNIQISKHFRATFYHGSLLTEKYPHLANVK